MNIEEMSDPELIKLFRKGSLEAFEELITRYETKIFNLAMKYTRNQEDAEEVMQDVFTTLYKKIANFEGKSAFSSWLYRIVVNASFMKLRKNKQRPTVSFEDLPPAVLDAEDDQYNLFSTRSDEISINREVREILRGAIGKLPEQYRAVFILRDIDGLSNQEASEILDLSVPAVKSRLHRARMMLRKRLRLYYEEFTGKKVILDGNLVEVAAA